jgi:hypothetical protein
LGRAGRGQGGLIFRWHKFQKIGKFSQRSRQHNLAALKGLRICKKMKFNNNH